MDVGRERQTYAVLRSASPFVHYQGVFVTFPSAAPSGDRPNPNWMSYCSTAYPALRCECAMFDLEWHEDPAMAAPAR